MAYFQIKSNNPKFSYIISKNPDTGMLIKECRKGNSFGWYSDNNTAYNIYFQDEDNDVSYKKNPDQEFEYLDISRYNSPVFIFDTINDYFNHILKEEENPDDIYTGCEVKFNVYAKNQYLDLFKNHFKDYIFEIKQIHCNNYQVTITGYTVKQLISLSLLISAFLAVRNRDNFFIDAGNIEKYLKIIGYLDAPYFIRNVFKTFIHEGLFNKYKPMLEKSEFHKYDLVHFNNGQSRRKYIMDNLSFENHIVDFGCGEGDNYFGKLVEKLANKSKNKFYYGLDINEEAIEIINKKAKKREYKNVKTILGNDFEQHLNPEEKYDFVLSEVFEHLEKDKAIELVNRILSFKGTNSLLITTPNKDFNEYYNLAEDEMRLDDHIYEYSAYEFEKIIMSIEFKVETKMDWIGDKVNLRKPISVVKIIKGENN